MRSYRKKKQEDLIKIETLLPTLFEKVGWKDKVRDFQIFEIWTEVAQELGGDKVSSRTFAHRIGKKRELFVAVKSAALANELQLLKRKFEAKFRELSQKRKIPTVSKIIFELRTN